MQVIRASLAELGDVSRIIAALNFLGHQFSDPRIVKRQIARGRYFLCRHNNRAVGAIGLNQRDGACQIFAIASTVKGAGRAMIEFAIEECKANGLPKLWCWSLLRYRAKGFYEKMGFEESTILRRQWYGEDCYFFGKVIS